MNGHAHDADAILGDNGNIYRVVGRDRPVPHLRLRQLRGLVGARRPAGRAAARLHADSARRTPRPTRRPRRRATTVAGTGNRGAADFLHGEAGNDLIYGQTGADTLFGDGQDDLVYGNAGADWISGGTGDDGILGDDGLLSPSRNGIAEPLFGLAATVQSTSPQSGDQQPSTLYVTGDLRYVADLEPFFTGRADVIYGGLGNDAIHGGVGDDAISGAEALALYYAERARPARRPQLARLHARRRARATTRRPRCSSGTTRTTRTGR